MPARSLAILKQLVGGSGAQGEVAFGTGFLGPVV